MFKKPVSNYPLVFWLAIIAGLIVVLLVPSKSTIVIMNGIFAGSISGIVYAYWRLIVATVVGHPPFDRARQYALGVFILWTAYCITVTISIIARAAGNEADPHTLIVASRYFAILGAWLQVNAPDFGADLFGSKDRKVLWSAVTICLCVSIVSIIAQEQTVLEQ